MFGRLKLVLCIHREEKTKVNVIFCTVLFHKLMVAMATKVLTFSGSVLRPLSNGIVY